MMPKKMLNLPAQMRDEKYERMMRNEKMNVEGTKDRKNSVPGNDAKKCCRTDCHDNAQTGDYHPDP